MSRRPESSDDFDDEEAELEAAAKKAAKAAAKKAAKEAASAAAPTAPSLWQQYDLGVIIFALAIFAGGVFAHRNLTRPTLLDFEHTGLHFQRPSGWLPGVHPEREPAPLADFGASLQGSFAKAKDSDAKDYHVIYTSPYDPRLRLEVRISAPPRYKNLNGALSVARMARYGEYYWVRDSHRQSIAKRDWLRTEFRYAFKSDKAGSPQIAEAIEYATMNDEQLYVVVVHGDPVEIEYVDNLLSRSLRVVAQENPL